MTDSPLQDSAVQKAVSGIQLRSERQEDLEQLVSTFVDPGISVQLQNDNNQILYGRRGTGKTHVLKVVQAVAMEQSDTLALYIDMRTLGSSSVFSDELRPMHIRVTSLLRDVLGFVEVSLLEWATDPERDPPGDVFAALNEFTNAIVRTTLSGVEVSEEMSESKGRQERSGLGVELSATPRVSLESASGINASETTRVERRGAETVTLLFQEVAQALDRVLETAGLARMVLLFDEWTAIPTELQPLLAEFLKRSMFSNPRITVKIGSIEYRSNFTQPLDKNNVIGFELGADISSALDLDDYYVYDKNPVGTVEMFSRLLYRHLAAETVSDQGDHYLADKHSVSGSEQFVKAFFASPDAFEELVRAGEGVARDFINIFTSAFFNAVRRQRNNIDLRAVREAAREWYEKDKAYNFDTRHETILRRILDDVIGARTSRSFLLPKELENHEAIQSLFDYRVIHLVQRGYADKDNPGRRYNIYTLDFGTYVDLYGTKTAPTLDFTEELTAAESAGDVVVPFDDKRSIRRIILREEHLQVEAP